MPILFMTAAVKIFTIGYVETVYKGEDFCTIAIYSYYSITHECFQHANVFVCFAMYMWDSISIL